MSALVRMRLAGFLRTGRALARCSPRLVVLGILYGGGRAQAGEAYGVSAVVLFPVLAWQTKILLDVEPDVQRRLARVAVGRGPGARSPGCSRPAWPALVAVAGRAGLPVAGRRGDRAGRPGRPAAAGGHRARRLGAPAAPCPPAVALGALASRASTGERRRTASRCWPSAASARSSLGLTRLGGPVAGAAADGRPPATTAGDAAALTLLALSAVGARLVRRGVGGYLWRRRARR